MQKEGFLMCWLLLWYNLAGSKMPYEQTKYMMYIYWLGLRATCILTEARFKQVPEAFTAYNKMHNAQETSR